MGLLVHAPAHYSTDRNVTQPNPHNVVFSYYFAIRVTALRVLLVTRCISQTLGGLVAFR